MVSSVQRRIMFGLGPLLVLALAAPTLAEGGSSSAFAMFFYNKDEFMGTLVIWFLILVSVAQVALIGQAFLKTRRQAFIPPTMVTDLEALLTEKKYRETIELTQADISPFGQIMNAAMSQAPRGYVAMEQAMEETAENIGGHSVRALVWLEIAGAAGPMCGLFGTVYGMIVTFNALAAAQGAVSPGALAGGIGTALVCTFWGLIVGIPGVTFAALFRVKVEGLISESIHEASKLVGQFRPAPGGAAAKKPAAPAPAAAPKPVEAKA